MSHPIDFGNDLDVLDLQIQALQEDPTVREMLDDAERNEIAAAEQAEDRQHYSECDLGAFDAPPVKAVRDFVVILPCGGYVARLSAVVRGSTIGALLMTKGEAENVAAAVRGAVVAKCACAECVAGRWHSDASCPTTWPPSLPPTPAVAVARPAAPVKSGARIA
jgi:hypothetical protein